MFCTHTLQPAGGPGGAGGFGGGGFDPYQGGGMNADFIDSIFRSFTGGAGRAGAHGQGMSVGGDLETTMRISFMEAVKGVEKTLTYPAIATCKPCSGSGVKPGSRPTRCDTCKGTGEVTRNIPNHSFLLISPSSPPLLKRLCFYKVPSACLKHVILVVVWVHLYRKKINALHVVVKAKSRKS